MFSVFQQLFGTNLNKYYCNFMYTTLCFLIQLEILELSRIFAYKCVHETYTRFNYLHKGKRKSLNFRIGNDDE